MRSRIPSRGRLIRRAIALPLHPTTMRLIALALACARPAGAQEAAKPPAAGTPSRNSDLLAHATYVDVRPEIDGVLDELFWPTIPPITDFKQRLPDEGAEPTEPTEVRIAYDENNLYFGFTLFDSEPEKIKRTILKREGYIPQDDFVYIGLDSYNDDRNGYLFELNSLGTQGDALITDEEDIAWNWEGVFETQGQVNDEGWVLEVAIPFKTIRFDPKDPLEMGIVFARGIVRKNERVYWPLIDLDYRRFSGLAHASQYATLVGLQNVTPGRNLEVKPYGMVGGQKVNLGIQGTENDTDGDFGLDVKYGITSNLTLDLTYNTDFAQVEADNVQVNLTRFNLRFPEKREFFLERAGLFSFGATGTETFFSRRIGITNDILFGARFTGQAGPFSIGMLDIQTKDRVEDPGTNFAVSRIRGDLRPGLTVGTIFTNRDNGQDYNRAVGGDVAVRFWSGSTFDAWATNVWSSEGDGRSSAGARRPLDQHGPVPARSGLPQRRRRLQSRGRIRAAQGHDPLQRKGGHLAEGRPWGPVRAPGVAGFVRQLHRGSGPREAVNRAGRRLQLLAREHRPRWWRRAPELRATGCPLPHHG